MKQVNIKDISPNGPIRTPLLPEGFIERVRKFKKILEEVETTTLEHTVLNFQRDNDPEKELRIWEHIADTYQKFINENSNFSLEQKKEALKVILGLSMGIERLNDIKTLNSQQVEDLQKRYSVK